MSTLAVVGAQWGDEGKGKVVDVLAAKADVVARYAGGNNAGHTLVVDGKKTITHLVPSGCTYPGTKCVLGSGMVIDPDVFIDEVASIRAGGLLGGDELRVALDAHVVLPHHRALDGAREDQRADTVKIGTTRRGIGPAYEAKAARRGVRIRDLYDATKLRAMLERASAVVDPELERLGSDHRVDVDDVVARAAAWSSFFEPMVCDAAEFVLDAIEAKQRVLFEGAQGAMLDLDHGTYPFVTSSNTIAGGVCTGLGIGPRHIDEVWGITKAYATRVGAGPFPTRLEGDEAHALREAGGEYGATTGRPRDCGWLDMPALRRACRRNGLTGLCVTKLDVLAALPSVAVCRRYRDGADPVKVGYDAVVPELEPVEGWGDADLLPKVAAARDLGSLPSAARAYLESIEDACNVPITLVSVGPDRSQTIMVRDAFAPV